MQPQPQQYPAAPQPPPRTTFWQRINALSTPQKIGAGVGALVIVCVMCSCITAALANSTSPTTNSVVGAATATATTATTTAPTATTAATAPAATATAQSQPTNTPHAQPTHTPCADPCNPWGYNFSCCNNIYNPPSNFCSYFNCIPSFWNSTNGYVEECQDATFSHSGGVSGSCSHHGGNWRPLYAP